MLQRNKMTQYVIESLTPLSRLHYRYARCR
jgi:hypothetical protein